MQAPEFKLFQRNQLKFSILFTVLTFGYLLVKQKVRKIKLSVHLKIEYLIQLFVTFFLDEKSNQKNQDFLKKAKIH